MNSNGNLGCRFCFSDRSHSIGAEISHSIGTEILLSVSAGN